MSLAQDRSTREIDGVPVTTMNDVDVPDAILNPIETGHDVLDDFFSMEGGVPKASIIIVGGDPGAGKTTLTCDILGEAETNGNDCLFISSEMDRVDFKKYSKRFPKFGSFTTYFPTMKRDILNELESLIEHGFDLVLIDSFKDIKDKIAEQRSITKTKAELFLVDLMKRAKNGIETDRGEYYTTTMVIQQMTKAGDFAGSNALKHVVTAVARLVVENEYDSYVTFEKNRRGEAHNRLYYEIGKDYLKYDAERREREKEAVEFMDEEKDRKDENDYASVEDLMNDLDGDNSENQESDSSNGGWTGEWNSTSLSNEEHREVIREIYDEQGSMRSAHKRAQDESFFPENQSYHYFRKMLHDYDLNHYSNY